MAKTVQSAISSYLSPTEFLKRVDNGTVGDLCTDNKVRLTADQLLNNANLQAALDDASGAFESATMRGQKYSPEDLGTLMATPSVGRAMVYRVLTALTKVFLCERRPGTKVPDEFVAGAAHAEAYLHALEQGDMILAFKETADAGLPNIEAVTPDEVRIRFGPVVQAERYFGTRSDRANGPGGW